MSMEKACRHGVVLLLDGGPIHEVGFKGQGFTKVIARVVGFRQTTTGETGWFCLECQTIVAPAS